MVETVTIPLGGRNFIGQPLPPTGTYYIPGGQETPAGTAPYVEPQFGPQPGVPAAEPGALPAGTAPWVETTPGALPPAAQPMAALPAAGYGALHGATFGAYPAIAGLAGASGMPAPDITQTGPAVPEGIDPLAATVSADPSGVLKFLGQTVARPFVGAYELLAGGKDRVEAYNKAREEALAEIEKAKTDQPGAFIAGGVAGGLATIPAMGPLGSLRAGTVLGRVAQSGKVGGVTGGAFGAGEATSHGESPLQVGKEALKGAAVGAPLGAALGGTIETGAHVLGRAAQIARARRDPEGEAARQVIEALRGPGRASVGRFMQDQPALQAGQEAGTPIFNADVGGQATRRLLRGAVTRSPEGQETAAGRLTERFRGQADRIGDWILDRFGGGDVGGTLGALQLAARRANAPNYQRAQAAADRRFPQGIWTTVSHQGRGLEELLSTPAVQQAMQTAIEKGANASVLEGLGAFNPRVTFEGGRLVFNRRGGVPAFPDLQLWDYTQRALRDMALAAPRGSNEARVLNGLQRELLAELDRLVPEFGHARGVASQFFGASDALQAGEDFVRATRVGGRRLRDPEVARQVARMSPEDRALFQYGFATELANAVRGTGDNRNVVNAIASNLNARRRVEIALGRDGAEELQALLRLEGLIDRSRTAAMGNSLTSQNVHDLQTGVAGGIGASFNPVYWIAGAILLSGRHAAREIDQRVANQVAEMLTSTDPAVLRRGLAIVTRNPVMREAFRRAADLSERELMAMFGPGGVAAGGAVAVQKMLPSFMSPQAPPQQDRHREDENQ